MCTFVCACCRLRAFIYVAWWLGGNRNLVASAKSVADLPVAEVSGPLVWFAECVLG